MVIDLLACFVYFYLKTFREIYPDEKMSRNPEILMRQKF